MKLAELAAKLTLSQSEIITFLAKNETQIEENSDADLEDEHVTKVNTHFSSLKRRQRHKKAASNASIAPSAPDSLTSTSLQDENTEDNPNSTEKKVDVAPQVKTKEVVWIKAPKVALPGLKVVGKIELPQPKKKKSDDIKNAPTDNKRQIPVKKEIKENTGYKKRVNHKPRKSRIKQQDKSLPVKRRRKRSKQEKEERTQRYYEKIKNYNIPIKPLRKESDADYEVYEEEKEERPKNWLSKFLHWFVTS